MHGTWIRRGPALGLALVACAAVLAAGAGATDVTENVTPADAVSAVAGASSSVGENVTPSDAIATAPGQSSAVGENVTPGDGVALYPSQSSSVGENVTPSDVVHLYPSQQLSVGENLTPGDAVNFTPGALLQLTEGVTPGDTASAEIVNTIPILHLPQPIRIDEGVLLRAVGSFEDPDPQTWTATVDWGDGGQPQPLQLEQDKTFALDHVYDDNAKDGYTATVVVSDGLASTSDTFHVDVANVAPTAELANDGPVDEGSPATVSFSKQLDPSTADTAAGFTYAYDCGSGYGQPTDKPSAQCTFDDQGTYTVKATIADKDGGTTEYATDVVVRNVAPTADLTAPASVDEGAPATLSFSGQLDPSTKDTQAGFTYAYDCGSGYGAPTSDASAQCTFDDGPSTHTVHAKISDKDGGTTEYTRTIAVTNVAPTATLTAPANADEGSPVTVSFSSQHDPSQADTSAGFSYVYACDGTNFGQVTTSASTTCTFDDGPSTQTVKARIMDKDGGATDYTATVTVANVPPQATLVAPAAIDEGSSFTLQLTGAHDPSSADTAAGFTYAFDCGDGSGLGAFGTAATATCATTDSGTRTVHAAVKDKDGGVSTYDGTVVVRNVPPTATLVAPSSVDEGGTYTLSLTNPADPSSADTAAGFTYAFDCGTGAGYGTPSTTPSAVCTALDDPGVDVKAKIADKDGGATEYTAHIAVANVAPTVQITSPGAPTAVPVGTTVTFAGSFADAGVKDTHTATWSFDPATAPGVVTESNGSGTVAGSYTFTAAGVYTVSLSVTDNAGATGTATKTALVSVFDPNGGFLTGGGWIPDGTGKGKPKTQFSFSAKYVSGILAASFSSQVNNVGAVVGVRFRSLVVAGNRAQLSGDATLNGSPGYSFIVTAFASPDAFRLKLWRTADGSVVYDTVPGASDDIDQANPVPLGGGNVQIHK